MARTRNNILVRAICIYEFFKTSIAETTTPTKEFCSTFITSPFSQSDLCVKSGDTKTLSPISILNPNLFILQK